MDLAGGMCDVSNRGLGLACSATTESVLEFHLMRFFVAFHLNRQQ
jgi:hypothetical protein